MLMGHGELVVRETTFGPDGQGQAARRRSVNMVGSEDFTHPTMQPWMSQKAHPGKIIPAAIVLPFGYGRHLH
jgi:hypothetical protein